MTTIRDDFINSEQWYQVYILGSMLIPAVINAESMYTVKPTMANLVAYYSSIRELGHGIEMYERAGRHLKVDDLKVEKACPSCGRGYTDIGVLMKWLKNHDPRKMTPDDITFLFEIHTRFDIAIADTKIYQVPSETQMKRFVLPTKKGTA